MSSSAQYVAPKIGSIMADHTCSSPPELQSGFRTFMPAIMIALLAIIIEMFVFYAPPAKGQMAVFFPPDTSESMAIAAIASAGASFVGSSRFENIIIVYAPDTGFRQRISQHGGWFTLAAEGLCSPSSAETNI